MTNHLKNELHHVFSGKSQVRFGTTIQTIASHLTNGAPTSAIIESEKHYKREETKKLESYISKENLWIDIDFSQYVSEGAEQKVYLKDTESVIKLNDSFIIILGKITSLIYCSIIIFFLIRHIT